MISLISLGRARVHVALGHKQTATGILMPASTNDEILEGIVDHPGNKKNEKGDDICYDIEAGSTVFFPKYSALAMGKEDGKDVYLVKYEDICQVSEATK